MRLIGSYLYAAFLRNLPGIIDYIGLCILTDVCKVFGFKHEYLVGIRYLLIELHTMHASHI